MYRSTFSKGFSWLMLCSVLISSSALAEEKPVAPSVGNQIDGAIEWESENDYWRKNYPSRPYYKSTTEYGVYEPAYHYGTDAYRKYEGKRFEEIEGDLKAGWEKLKDKSSLTWEQAKDAVQDAYNRVYDRVHPSSSNAR